jgi:hypothetical protein
MTFVHGIWSQLQCYNVEILGFKGQTLDVTGITENVIQRQTRVCELRHFYIFCFNHKARGGRGSVVS